ncbi:MAG: hypothetical protein HY777_03380 [Betaproteobacteria bacterium]|nr:hypothetical protein [Betaproteobacteria bacterium]
MSTRLSGLFCALLALAAAPTRALAADVTGGGVLGAAALLLIYEPLSPNWSIEERPLGDETYHLSLRAKRFRTGGDGEALQNFKRRALQLQHDGGFSGYRILSYSEGIDSGTPFAQRYSEGTIQLVRADPGAVK